MKSKISVILSGLIFLLISQTIITAQQRFTVNLNDRSDDLFKVTLIPEKLSEQNSIYQFASTAPGTYQIMDIGRFVRSFKVYDDKGNELVAKHISTNQWELEEPVKTAKIIYTIADTWDTPMDKYPVYAMSGSSLEKDHAVINGQAVFGYFHGMQKYPIEIKLEYPNEWSVGTALEQNSGGYFSAPTYDYVVDSPILLGNINKASTKIENTTIDVFTYSKTGLIHSENILALIEDILNAASQFTQGLPVNRYVFLFHFENFSAGAWEHSYSSFYVFKEDSLNENFAKELKSVAAHEFFHVVTPLNIHSELVENFNYEKPVMSKHLWLYEGVTEWASDVLQMRDYLISVDDFLKQVKEKLGINDNFDQNLSLTELGVHATERSDQYFNIYNKGSVVATLLDIRLLELSNGKRGLRELINDLAKEYGPKRSFSEENFFNEFIAKTYPQIGEFINRYIAHSEKLPIKDYFAKVGIEYTESAGYDSSKIDIGFSIGLKDNQLIVTNVSQANNSKLKSGDILYKLNGDEITLQNIRQKFQYVVKLKVNDTIELTIKRDLEEIPVQITVEPREIRHIFKFMETPTKEQLALRDTWTKNLMSYKGDIEGKK